MSFLPRNASKPHFSIAGEEASKPFDLSAGPLLRARLLRLGSDDHILFSSSITLLRMDGL